VPVFDGLDLQAEAIPGETFDLNVIAKSGDRAVVIHASDTNAEIGELIGWGAQHL
jgi:hypothetical protein